MQAMTMPHLLLSLLSKIVCLLLSSALAAAAHACSKPLYLTFDTGHMEVAPFVAEVLNKHDVKVTFFVANEPTKPRNSGDKGGSALDDTWLAWWHARMAEGHVLGSHTFDNVYWQRDLPGGRMIVKPHAGPDKGKTLTLDSRQYCEQITRVIGRLGGTNGSALLPVFRAPGGRTSPNLLAAAKACGYSHVGWPRSGFLGDELPSDKYPNALLLSKALREIKSGDVLLAHLGILSRKDAWAPAVLEPLIVGLKARGFCFRTINQHPEYPHFTQASRQWMGY
jgi:peptidoglycan/xylan/chitin deacetylase (PgdA/CDA1 family)